MPVTNVKISMNEYMRLVAEDTKKAEGNPIYSKLLKDLSELAGMMQYYFKTDDAGNAPILHEEDYKKLIETYSKLAEDCNMFLKEDRNKNRLENKRIDMITKLSSCVAQDLRGLLKADTTKEVTLSDVVKEARTKTIDLTDKKLGREGCSLSDRIPLKSASGVEGFFTKKSVYEYNNAFGKILERIPNILPPEYLEEYNNNNGPQRVLKALKDRMGRNSIHSSNPQKKETAYLMIAKVLCAIKGNKNGLSEVRDMLKQDKHAKLAEDLQNLLKDCEHLNSQKEIHSIAGVQENSRIDQRNVAMSEVAALLGMPGIVAKATSMNIIQDGQVTEGTFMEKAEGEDISRLTKSSMMLQATEESFNHPDGLKQLANLQVLDYICGNVDRHHANMMYQFKKENGKVVLTGVCGFDNDSSFGTKAFTSEYEGKNITPLPAIKNITQSCYEAIKNISLDTLRVVLADKLSVAELDAVCHRAALLKNKVELAEKQLEGGVNVVQDHEWGKNDYTYNKLTDKKLGITKTIEKAIELVNIYKNIPENELGKISELTYTAGTDVTNQAELNFQKIYSKLESFVTRAGKLRGKFHNDSDEYREMLGELKTALDSGKEIKDKLEKKENVDLKKFETFAKTVVNLGIASQEYMDAKNLSQFTERGRDRFALAREMRDLAQENFAIKEKPAKESVQAMKEPEPIMIL